MAYEPQVYKSPKLNFTVELWARDPKPVNPLAASPLGPHFQDRRVAEFQLGTYVAKDPEEELALESHPLYGNLFVNKRVWDNNTNIRATLNNKNKVALRAGREDALKYMPEEKNRAEFGVVHPGAPVSCPHCGNLVEYQLWAAHRDHLHPEAKLSGVS